MVPGTFLFDGVVASGGTSLYYLASNMIASHPASQDRPSAQAVRWAGRQRHQDGRRAQLCATLGSRLGLDDVCGFDDIPLQFGSGGGTSTLPSPPFCNCNDDPAVTASNPAAPCNTKGCPKFGPLPLAASQLPTDGYSRGVAAPLYINGADPFWLELGRA